MVALLAAPLAAADPLDLAFPAPARVTADRQDPLTTYRMPVGPWRDAAIPTLLAEGALEQRGFRLDLHGASTLQILRPLREQLEAAGFVVAYECETNACGGFDFRYGTDVLPEPDMHVDLGDFRYLAASRDTASGPEVVSLIVSRSSASGFVQVTRVGGVPDVALALSTKSGVAAEDPARPAALDLPEGGAPVALEDLVFATGAGSLAPGDYPSLGALAEFLRRHPERRIALVGHTDASGPAEVNRTLSQQRAAAVRDYLVAREEIAAERITAEGVGFRSPRDSNDTEEGRARNRRVEVMLAAPL